MQKYKIKLMPGDCVLNEGLNIGQYEDIGNRFIDDGCPRCEFPDLSGAGLSGQSFSGWDDHPNKGFYHCSNRRVYEGRLLTYSQIMELAGPEQLQCKPDKTWVDCKLLLEDDDLIIVQCADQVRYFRDKARVRKVDDVRQRTIDAVYDLTQEKGYMPSKHLLADLYDLGVLCLPEGV